jgi:hypothetical protein
LIFLKTYFKRELGEYDDDEYQGEDYYPIQDVCDVKEVFYRAKLQDVV